MSQSRGNPDCSKCPVFFGWQSDSPVSSNRNLIRRALESACALQVDEPIRPDEAGKGASGTIDIPESIFRKIREAAVAVFDVTIVGTTFAEDSPKSLPNPNVLIELGYAASAIGWERIVMVFNKDGDHTREELPFDLRHRRFPFTYSTSTSKTAAEKQLAFDLDGAIRACMSAPHEQATVMRGRLDHDVLVAIRRIGQEVCFHHGEDAEISIETVRRMLDIGMVWCDQAMKEGRYAYHFSYVGNLLRQQLLDEAK